MIQTPPIQMNYFVNAGNALLLGAGGISIVRALRRRSSIEPALYSFAAGILGMTFYQAAFEYMMRLSNLMEGEVQNLGNPQVLKDLVWESIRAASNEAGPNGEHYSINIPAVVEQVFRTGVWGIATSIGDFFFLLADAFIKVRRDVLLTIVQFLFPLIWGLFPLIPAMGTSIVAYVLEMSLWGPCLYLVHIIVGYVAPRYLHQPNSLGIPIVATEIVATLIILNIPAAIHQLLRGTLHPHGENAAMGLFFIGSKAFKPVGRVVSVAQGLSKQGGKNK